MDFEFLLEKAKHAREHSYAPYSKFSVGAAVLTVSGKIFTGCNVENAAYGLSICAETTAITKAVSEGHKDIKAIAVVADLDGVCRPCGSCRQVILEFGNDIKVIMGNLKGDFEMRKINELIPDGFSGLVLK